MGPPAYWYTFATKTVKKSVEHNFYEFLCDAKRRQARKSADKRNLIGVQNHTRHFQLPVSQPAITPKILEVSNTLYYQVFAMALERLEPSFSTFSIYLRLSMIESPQEMSNTQTYRRIVPVCSRFTTF